MIDKHIDDLHSEEAGTLVPESVDLGNNNVDISVDMKSLDSSLNEKSKQKEEDSTKRDVERDLDTLAQSVHQKKSKDSQPFLLPQWITQAQFDTLARISASPEALAWRLASAESVHKIVQNSDNWFVRNLAEKAA